MSTTESPQVAKMENEEEETPLKCWYSKYRGETSILIKKKTVYTRVPMDEVPWLVLQLIKLYQCNPNYPVDYMKNALDYGHKLLWPKYYPLIDQPSTLEFDDGGPIQKDRWELPKVVINGHPYAKVDYKLPVNIKDFLKIKRENEQVVEPYVENIDKE